MSTTASPDIHFQTNVNITLIKNFEIPDDPLVDPKNPESDSSPLDTLTPKLIRKNTESFVDSQSDPNILNTPSGSESSVDQGILLPNCKSLNEECEAPLFVDISKCRQPEKLTPKKELVDNSPEASVSEISTPVTRRFRRIKVKTSSAHCQTEESEGLESNRENGIMEKVAVPKRNTPNPHQSMISNPQKPSSSSSNIDQRHRHLENSSNMPSSGSSSSSSRPIPPNATTNSSKNGETLPNSAHSIPPNSSTASNTRPSSLKPDNVSKNTNGHSSSSSHSSTYQTSNGKKHSSSSNSSIPPNSQSLKHSNSSKGPNSHSSSVKPLISLKNGDFIKSSNSPKHSNHHEKSTTSTNSSTSRESQSNVWKAPQKSSKGHFFSSKHLSSSNHSTSSSSKLTNSSTTSTALPKSSKEDHSAILKSLNLSNYPDSPSALPKIPKFKTLESVAQTGSNDDPNSHSKSSKSSKEEPILHTSSPNNSTSSKDDPNSSKHSNSHSSSSKKASSSHSHGHKSQRSKSAKDLAKSGEHRHSSSLSKSKSGITKNRTSAKSHSSSKGQENVEDGKSPSQNPGNRPISKGIKTQPNNPADKPEGNPPSSSTSTGSRNDGGDPRSEFEVIPDPNDDIRMKFRKKRSVDDFELPSSSVGAAPSDDEESLPDISGPPVVSPFLKKLSPDPPTRVLTPQKTECSHSQSIPKNRKHDSRKDAKKYRKIVAKGPRRSKTQIRAQKGEKSSKLKSPKKETLSSSNLIFDVLSQEPRAGPSGQQTAPKDRKEASSSNLSIFTFPSDEDERTKGAQSAENSGKAKRKYTCRKRRKPPVDADFKIQWRKSNPITKDYSLRERVKAATSDSNAEEGQRKSLPASSSKMSPKGKSCRANRNAKANADQKSLKPSVLPSLPDILLMQRDKSKPFTEFFKKSLQRAFSASDFSESIRLQRMRPVSPNSSSTKKRKKSDDEMIGTTPTAGSSTSIVIETVTEISQGDPVVLTCLSLLALYGYEEVEFPYREETDMSIAEETLQTTSLNAGVGVVAEIEVMTTDQESEEHDNVIGIDEEDEDNLTNLDSETSGTSVVTDESVFLWQNALESGIDDDDGSISPSTSSSSDDIIAAALHAAGFSESRAISPEEPESPLQNTAKVPSPQSPDITETAFIPNSIVESGDLLISESVPDNFLQNVGKHSSENSVLQNEVQTEPHDLSTHSLDLEDQIYDLSLAGPEIEIHTSDPQSQQNDYISQPNEQSQENEGQSWTNDSDLEQNHRQPQNDPQSQQNGIHPQSSLHQIEAINLQSQFRFPDLQPDTQNASSRDNKTLISTSTNVPSSDAPKIMSPLSIVCDNHNGFVRMTDNQRQGSTTQNGVSAGLQNGISSEVTIHYDEVSNSSEQDYDATVTIRVDESLGFGSSLSSRGFDTDNQRRESSNYSDEDSCDSIIILYEGISTLPQQNSSTSAGVRPPPEHDYMTRNAEIVVQNNNGSVSMIHIQLEIPTTEPMVSNPQDTEVIVQSFGPEMQSINAVHLEQNRESVLPSPEPAVQNTNTIHPNAGHSVRTTQPIVPNRESVASNTAPIVPNPEQIVEIQTTISFVPNTDPVLENAQTMFGNLVLDTESAIPMIHNTQITMQSMDPNAEPIDNQRNASEVEHFQLFKHVFQRRISKGRRTLSNVQQVETPARETEDAVSLPEINGLDLETESETDEIIILPGVHRAEPVAALNLCTHVSDPATDEGNHREMPSNPTDRNSATSVGTLSPFETNVQNSVTMDSGGRVAAATYIPLIQIAATNPSPTRLQNSSPDRIPESSQSEKITENELSDDEISLSQLDLGSDEPAVNSTTKLTFYADTETTPRDATGSESDLTPINLKISTPGQTPLQNLLNGINNVVSKLQRNQNQLLQEEVLTSAQNNQEASESTPLDMSMFPKTSRRKPTTTRKLLMHPERTGIESAGSSNFLQFPPLSMPNLGIGNRDPEIGIQNLLKTVCPGKDGDLRYVKTVPGAVSQPTPDSLINLLNPNPVPGTSSQGTAPSINALNRRQENHPPTISMSGPNLLQNPEPIIENLAGSSKKPPVKKPRGKPGPKPKNRIDPDIPSDSFGSTIQDQRATKATKRGRPKKSDQDSMNHLKALRTCNVCKFAYSCPKDASTCLARHRRKQCWICGYLLYDGETFQSHNTRFHSPANSNPEGVKCPLCSEILPFNIQLRIHMEARHFQIDPNDMSGNDSTVPPPIPLYTETETIAAHNLVRLSSSSADTNRTGNEDEDPSEPKRSRMSPMNTEDSQGTDTASDNSFLDTVRTVIVKSTNRSAPCTITRPPPEDPSTSSSNLQPIPTVSIQAFGVVNANGPLAQVPPPNSAPVMAQNLVDLNREAQILPQSVQILPQSVQIVPRLNNDNNNNNNNILRPIQPSRYSPISPALNRNQDLGPGPSERVLVPQPRSPARVLVPQAIVPISEFISQDPHRQIEPGPAHPRSILLPSVSNSSPPVQRQTPPAPNAYGIYRQRGHSLRELIQYPGIVNGNHLSIPPAAPRPTEDPRPLVSLNDSNPMGQNGQQMIAYSGGQVYATPDDHQRNMFNVLNQNGQIRNQHTVHHVRGQLMMYNQRQNHPNLRMPYQIPRQHAPFANHNGNPPNRNAMGNPRMLGHIPAGETLPFHSRVTLPQEHLQPPSNDFGNYCRDTCRRNDCTQTHYSRLQNGFLNQPNPNQFMLNQSANESSATRNSRQSTTENRPSPEQGQTRAQQMLGCHSQSEHGDPTARRRKSRQDAALHRQSEQETSVEFRRQSEQEQSALRRQYEQEQAALRRQPEHEQVDALHRQSVQTHAAALHRQSEQVNAAARCRQSEQERVDALHNQAEQEQAASSSSQHPTSSPIPQPCSTRPQVSVPVASTSGIPSIRHSTISRRSDQDHAVALRRQYEPEQTAALYRQFEQDHAASFNIQSGQVNAAWLRQQSDQQNSAAIRRQPEQYNDGTLCRQSQQEQPVALHRQSQPDHVTALNRQSQQNNAVTLRRQAGQEQAVTIQNQSEQVNAAAICQQSDQQNSTAIRRQSQQDNAATLHQQAGQEQAATIRSQSEQVNAAAISQQSDQQNSAAIRRQAEQEQLEQAAPRAHSEQDDAASLRRQAEQEQAAPRQQAEEDNTAPLRRQSEQEQADARSRQHLEEDAELLMRQAVQAGAALHRIVGHADQEPVASLASSSRQQPTFNSARPRPQGSAQIPLTSAMVSIRHSTEPVLSGQPTIVIQERSGQQPSSSSLNPAPINSNSARPRPQASAQIPSNSAMVSIRHSTELVSSGQPAIVIQERSGQQPSSSSLNPAPMNSNSARPRPQGSAQIPLTSAMASIRHSTEPVSSGQPAIVIQERSGQQHSASSLNPAPMNSNSVRVVGAQIPNNEPSPPRIAQPAEPPEQEQDLLQQCLSRNREDWLRRAYFRAYIQWSQALSQEDQVWLALMTDPIVRGYLETNDFIYSGVPNDDGTITLPLTPESSQLQSLTGENLERFLANQARILNSLLDHFRIVHFNHRIV